MSGLAHTSGTVRKLKPVFASIKEVFVEIEGLTGRTLIAALNIPTTRLTVSQSDCALVARYRLST